MLNLGFVLQFGGLVQHRFGGTERDGFDEMQVVVPRQLAGQPQKRLLKIVVGFGGNIVVLQILLAVEGNLLGFDFAVLDLHLVPHEDNWNVLADAGEIAVPVRDVLVSDTGRDIEHDNRALTLDVVPVAQSTKFFLPRRVPHVEFDGTTVGIKGERMDLHAERCDVFLFKLPRQMALDKGGFPDTAVTDQNQLEFRCSGREWLMRRLES